MRSLLCLAVVLAPMHATPALASPDGYQTGQLSDHLEPGYSSEQVRIAQVGGVDTLLVNDASVRFKTTPVRPNTKYTLCGDCSFTGSVESLEENPRLDYFAQPGRKSNVLPYREITFLDSEGKRIGQPRILAMPLRRKQTYRDVFYTPSDAIAIRLVIGSGEGVTVALSGLSLKNTPNENAINVNPTFQLGPLNYSGWQNISAGGKLLDKDGKTVLDTKYGSRGTRFPLPGPGTYALSAKATGNGYNSCVKADIFDAKGNKLMSAVLRRYDQSHYFVPPPEATTASFLVYSCLLEEVRLVRVGDEKAIEELTDSSRLP